MSVSLGAPVSRSAYNRRTSSNSSRRAPSDFDLLTAWQRGDNQAGDQLVRKHFWSVYRFFRSKVESAAEDLTQRTFLGCVEARDRVKAELSFRAYLFGIARFQLTRYLRRHSRSVGLFSPEDASIADLTGSLDRGVARQEEQRMLVTALRQIPIDFQITVELYYWEDMSVAEIAEVLGVAPGTVKSRLGRARAELKKRLDRLAARRRTPETTSTDLDAWARSLRSELVPAQ